MITTIKRHMTLKPCCVATGTSQLKIMWKLDHSLCQVHFKRQHNCTHVPWSLQSPHSKGIGMITFIWNLPREPYRATPNIYIYMFILGILPETTVGKHNPPCHLQIPTKALSYKKEAICEHGPEDPSCPVGQGSFKMDCFKVKKCSMVGRVQILQSCWKSWMSSPPC